MTSPTLEHGDIIFTRCVNFFITWLHPQLTRSGSMLKYVTWPCWLEGACWDPEPCTGPWSSPPASASPGEARSASPCRKTQKSNKAARQKMKEGSNWGFLSLAEHGGAYRVFKLASDYKHITDKWNLTAESLIRNSLRSFSIVSFAQLTYISFKVYPALSVIE